MTGLSSVNSRSTSLPSQKPINRNHVKGTETYKLTFFFFHNRVFPRISLLLRQRNYTQFHHASRTITATERSLRSTYKLTENQTPTSSFKQRMKEDKIKRNQAERQVLMMFSNKKGIDVKITQPNDDWSKINESQKDRAQDPKKRGMDQMSLKGKNWIKSYLYEVEHSMLHPMHGWHSINQCAASIRGYREHSGPDNLSVLSGKTLYEFHLGSSSNPSKNRSTKCKSRGCKISI